MDAERSDQELQDEWSVTWEGHHERQLTWGLEATPSQRMAWLEEAIRFADSLGLVPPLSVHESPAGDSASRPS